MIKNKIIYNPFSNFQFKLSKAEESFIWDEKGKKMIDFTSGWNVANLGWNNPEINLAMVKQIEKNCYAPMWSMDFIQEEYANLLTKSLPKELNTVARGTGGTEANEMAIKTARAFTGRKKILGFKDTYHGQSFATLSIGYDPNYIIPILPLLPGFNRMDFPKMETENNNKILKDFEHKLESLLKKKEFAAIVCEAGIITGWGSTFVAPKGFLSIIQAITKKYGTMLILDEVGTGFSRCGKLFGMEIENIVPDIVTFAKGMSNGGAAIGAMVTKKDIGEICMNKTNPTSTFGWMSIACAAAKKTLEIHLRDKIWEKSKKDGQYICNILRKMLKTNKMVKDIDGVGMEIGVHLVKTDKPMMRKYIEQAHGKGLHLCYADDFNFQIMPPLTIDRKTLDQGLEIFIDLLKN